MLRGRGGEGRGGRGRKGREGGEGGRGRREGGIEGGGRSTQVPARDTPIYHADYLSCISPCHERI